MFHDTLMPFAERQIIIMKIFYPIFFLSVTNKLVEYEFGKNHRYFLEFIVCILLTSYAIRYNAYVINCTYIIIMMLFDFILLPFLTSLIRKSAYFQNRRPLQIGEKKCILYWLSLIDLGFIICVNIKSFGHFFAIEYVVRNSLWNKYVSADNFRYVYNIFSIILLISIAKMVWKLRANTDIGQETGTDE